MCKTRKDTLAAAPTRKPQPTARFSANPSGATLPSLSSPSALVSTSFPTTTSDADAHTDGRAAPGSSSSNPTTSSTSSGALSIPSLREILPEPPNLYDFSEICSATNNFLGKRLSSTSNSWRCTLRGKDAVVFQRRFHGDPAALRRRLAASSKIHHNSIVRLLGAALGGDYIYLAYEYVPGASLADCLRNPMNPGYTPLGAWVDRMQVATDLAQGLQYIHHFTAPGIAVPPSTPHKSDGYKVVSRRRPVHNRIKSSSVMITETQHRAKICHFGAAELAGEISVSSDSEEDQMEGKNGTYEDNEILEFNESPSAHLPSKLPMSRSRKQRFEGTRGYIAPEVRDGGSPTQNSDVFAFGVVLLELLTGEEPLKYKYDRERKAFERVSLIETAREVMICEEEAAAEEDEGEAEAGREAMLAGERHQRLRRWMDRRLNDSFPVEVAERIAALALECVREEADRRPDMVRVAGKLSRLLLQSRVWADKLGVPADFTVSMAPR
ncbi:hypothetical protein Taro_043910 [Colocasia esculenta]|uniref:Protein kinase domain-containing protein n=1 Tax=Colocasia esculenta TaxID=4460 RepID=A0A843X2E8_COLES|nr:hypothetical protein [Colocasia esculenta]